MAYKVTALENGKILVLATMRHFDLTTFVVRVGIGVLRYKGDGTLGSSFGENGLAVSFFGNGITQPSVTADNLIVQPDGKILIDGEVQS